MITSFAACDMHAGEALAMHAGKAGIMENDQEFHIAFGVDANYFRGMGVAIASIVEKNRATHFVFHVFAFQVSDADQRRLDQLKKAGSVDIVVHIIDPSVFDEFSAFPSFSHFSSAIFTRLLIPAALQRITKRVLYVDADVLCVDSIAELISLDISNAIAAVVEDSGAEAVKMQCEKLDLTHRRYFNSGILYINIENWIANNITQLTILKVLESEKKFMFPDQDALNIILDGRATFIDPKWNFQYNVEGFLKQGDVEFTYPREVKFIHFTGRLKPWHNWNLHKSKYLFQKYQKVSPWAAMPLDAPRNHKEMKMFSQFLFKRKHVIKGVAWYCRYMLNRFMTVTLKSQ
ncbi:glycosyltransferase family 8 protein [Collimonas pratensis]|uniref:Glycosyl transferase 8 C-terminal family protein n=1 Tax=Collimonas pratensis TaxID=279113 RepID=A0ABM5Z2J3_9BURK|nr:glycosyltransferase [Collimonas pratensis]AMP13327.1 glycosyl transferase 8 C-terminal family protein [Collimonas pratensis]